MLFAKMWLCCFCFQLVDDGKFDNNIDTNSYFIITHSTSPRYCYRRNMKFCLLHLKVSMFQAENHIGFCPNIECEIIARCRRKISDTPMKKSKYYTHGGTILFIGTYLLYFYELKRVLWAKKRVQKFYVKIELENFSF